MLSINEKSDVTESYGATQVNGITIFYGKSLN